MQRRHLPASSLVLIDEFGKGTRAADGVALLGATLEYLLPPGQEPGSIADAGLPQSIPNTVMGSIACLYQLANRLCRKVLWLRMCCPSWVGPRPLSRAETVAMIESGSLEETQASAPQEMAERERCIVA